MDRMSPRGDARGGQLGEFLRTRRARVTPDQVGLVSYGARRVPGLRREELAQLAGISATYYTRLEQGQGAHASESVVEAVADALRLDDDERAHLHDLARPAPGSRRRTTRARAALRPGISRLVDSMQGVPALVLDSRTDVLAWNRLGHALLARHLELDAVAHPASRPNLTRMLFLDPRLRDLYPRWDEEAGRAVASLRLVAGRRREDRELAELVGELSLRSEDFARLWSRHPVHNCVSGVKHLHHPAVGALELGFEVLTLPDDSGQRLLTFTAEPDSPSAVSLSLLSSLAAEEVPLPLRAGREGAAATDHQAPG